MNSTIIADAAKNEDNSGSVFINSGSSQIGHINGKDDYELKKKKKTYSPYVFRFGNGANNSFLFRNEKRYKPMDAIEIMSTFTPQEWRFIKLLKDEMNVQDEEYKVYTTCSVKIDTKGLTPKDRKVFSTAYKRLHEKDIVRRIKRGGYYMINPNFIVPRDYKTELQNYYDLDEFTISIKGTK